MSEKTKEQNSFIDAELVQSVRELITEISELNEKYKRKFDEIDNKINKLNLLMRENDLLIKQVQSFFENAKKHQEMIENRVNESIEKITSTDEKLISLKRETYFQTNEIEKISSEIQKANDSSEVIKTFLRTQDTVKYDLELLLKSIKTLKTDKDDLVENCSSITNELNELKNNIKTIEQSDLNRFISEVSKNEEEFIQNLTEHLKNKILDQIVAASIQQIVENVVVDTWPVKFKLIKNN